MSVSTVGRSRRVTRSNSFMVRLCVYGVWVRHCCQVDSSVSGPRFWSFRSLPLSLEWHCVEWRVSPAAALQVCCHQSNMHVPCTSQVNGLWALLLCAGTLACCLSVGTARHWRYGTRSARALLADYGVPLCVVAWSALSFAISPASVSGPDVPRGIPRRISTPHTWEVCGEMGGLV